MSPVEPRDVDAIAILLRAAGRREPPPEESRRRAWQAVQATWERQLQRRRRWRAAAWLGGAAAAAAVVAMILPDVGPGGGPGPPDAGFGVDRVAGLVEVGGPRQGWQPLAPASPVRLTPGTALRTGDDGRVGLLLDDAVSLRIAPATEIRLLQARRVQLDAGRLYVDTGSGGGGTPLEIVTAGGTARDVGTQFEIRQEDGVLRLRVREGRVLLERDDRRLTADAGEQVAVDAAGVIARTRVAPDDPEWRWAEALAPAPAVDRQPVSMLLQWAARETGRRLAFADAAAAREAESTILHGEVVDLDPLATLQAMLATTDLDYTLLDDGTIEVRRK